LNHAFTRRSDEKRHLLGVEKALVAPYCATQFRLRVG
jgi:hypothetical protein